MPEGGSELARDSALDACHEEGGGKGRNDPVTLPSILTSKHPNRLWKGLRVDICVDVARFGMEWLKLSPR